MRATPSRDRYKLAMQPVSRQPSRVATSMSRGITGAGRILADGGILRPVESCSRRSLAVSCHAVLGFGMVSAYERNETNERSP